MPPRVPKTRGSLLDALVAPETVLGLSGRLADPVPTGQTIPLRHFSNRSDLTTVDPTYMGQGLPGDERIRIARDPDVPARSYYYLGDRRPEAGLGPNEYTTEIDPGLLYNLAEDPAGVVSEALRRHTSPDKVTDTGTIMGGVDRAAAINDVEKALRDRGYRGYIGAKDSVAVFDPLDVSPVSNLPNVRRADARPTTPAGAEGLQEQGGVRGGGELLPQQGGPDTLTRDLEGLPATVKVDGQPVTFGAYAPARQAAQTYAQKRGFEYHPPRTYAHVDKERASRIADEYDRMEHRPDDPEVKAAYDAMIEETLQQYQEILDSGLKVEFIDYEKMGDPYASNPRKMMLDVRDNNHMYVFSTRDGFGSDVAFDPSANPLLRETEFEISGQKALANDIFRVVHDYFGHMKDGVGFRAEGEENAWRSHSAMYSDLARRAMTTETRGQNSWVNYGPHGGENRGASAADTVYADQKTGLLPDWVVEEGRGDPLPPREQTKLGRYDPPRGKPKSLDYKVLGKRNADRLKGLVEQGVERGGDTWYHTGPIYDEFARVLGPESGGIQFERFMDFVAATSPLTDVPRNIRRGSYMFSRDAQGDIVTSLTNADLPEGYGHLAHKAHMGIADDILAGRDFDSVIKPKVASFAENLKGNLEPITIDTHNMRILFNNKLDRSPTKGEYLFLEEFQRRLADEVGLRPAEWQSALWVGGDKITGVKDSRPFIEIFDDAVVQMAEKQGKTPKQILHDFIQGKTPLASILVAGGAATLGSEDAEAGPMGTLKGKIGKPTREAFHGSPHTFDKFSSSAIGTGEGAQAYGHGLYFSSKEDIAKFYRDSLQQVRAPRYKGDRINLNVINDGGRDAATNTALKVLADNWQDVDAGDLSGVKATLKQMAEVADERGEFSYARAALGKVDDVAKDFDMGKAGKLYTVEIPDESQMLDWDKPLSEQSDEIKDVAARVLSEFSGATGENLDQMISVVRPQLDTSGMTGRELYNRAVSPDTRIADDPYKQASARLKELGIPGHTYSGRTSGERNFVIYDDEMINIIERGAIDPRLLAPLAGIGAAGAAALRAGEDVPRLLEGDELAQAQAAYEARMAEKRSFYNQLKETLRYDLDVARAGVDVAADFGSFMATPFLTVIPSVLEAALGYKEPRLRANLESRREALNYQPRTQMGAEASQYLQERAELVMGMVVQGAAVAAQNMPRSALPALGVVQELWDNLSPEQKFVVEQLLEVAPIGR